jgi:hypothetical protein
MSPSAFCHSGPFASLIVAAAPGDLLLERFDLAYNYSPLLKWFVLELLMLREK